MKINQMIRSEPKATFHGGLRMAQRGISQDAAQMVIREGRVIHKQNLKFFYVPKSKSKEWAPEEMDLVMDLIVITDLESKAIVTCYRNRKAVHEIKKKPKRLFR